MKNIQILSLAAAAGLLAGCASYQDHSESSAMTINQLPPAAQTTVRNEIGSQPISCIKQETKDGQTAYKVELQRQGMSPMHESLVVAADGSILKESRKLASSRAQMNEPAGAETDEIRTPSASSPAASPSSQAPNTASPSGIPTQGSPTTSARGL
ncbi:MAG TPA: hypothetical protein VFC44_09325 [Candidatus Saccharimonadales bacterium]|nr:hypothetical protein [Candidatus Saccharimonadales bacterium]